jgi:hypothetical protein
LDEAPAALSFSPIDFALSSIKESKYLLNFVSNATSASDKLFAGCSSFLINK